MALTIAGSDSGSGAGIQADLKSMAAQGVFAATVITAVTAQNTHEVRSVHQLEPAMVDAQIGAVVDDLPVRAVKTGLLGSAGVVEVVTARAARGELPQLVVDPVMVSSSGRVFLPDDGVEAYRRRLLPRALLVTPNLWEAAILAGLDPGDVVDVPGMREAARRIHALGPRWVLVKGGHLPGVELRDATTPPAMVTDLLFDGTSFTELPHRHVPTANTHGTGCSLSAAAAAHLAKGAEVGTAVVTAQEFVHHALVGASKWHLGHGHGPLDHLGWSPDPSSARSAARSQPGPLTAD